MIRRLRTTIARHLERRAFANTAQALGVSPKLAWALACDLIESPGDLRMAERLILDFARFAPLDSFAIHATAMTRAQFRAARIARGATGD